MTGNTSQVMYDTGITGDSDEVFELNDHVQTAVTAAMHDRLTLTCRLGEHTAHEHITWFRDR